MPQHKITVAHCLSVGQGRSKKKKYIGIHIIVPCK